MHVQVVLLDGFDPLDAIAPYEVLYAGGVASAGAVSVELVSAEGAHHQGLDALDASGAHAVRARVVDDGDLVTGAGVTSGLDLGLYLLERASGPRIAHAVEELFAHERRGVVWRAQGLAPIGF
nr:DJ-1/PfpI family protein [Streptomyces sp.]